MPREVARDTPRISQEIILGQDPTARPLSPLADSDRSITHLLKAFQLSPLTASDVASHLTRTRCSWFRVLTSMLSPMLPGLDHAPLTPPIRYALYHDLTQQIKAGSTGALPCAFNDVIYVGHSYGSEIGASMAQLYPGDFESIVLTGFSKLVLPSLLGVSLQLPVPAAVHDPSRFADLALGYVTSSYESGKTNSFFGTRAGIDYDPENAHLFYTREDVVSLGQFVTTYSGNSPAPAYKGRILVLTGGKDQAFCGPGSPVLGPADCATLVPGTQTLFPNAEYNYRIIPNTGHSVNLHFNGHSAFVTAHQFLAGQRFSN